jgi:hypothetical protein
LRVSSASSQSATALEVRARVCVETGFGHEQARLPFPDCGGAALDSGLVSILVAHEALDLGAMVTRRILRSFQPPASWTLDAGDPVPVAPTRRLERHSGEPLGFVRSGPA